MKQHEDTDHYHVWICPAPRYRNASRYGRFTTKQAAQKWGRRWGGPVFWIRKCDLPDECTARPVQRQAP